VRVRGWARTEGMRRADKAQLWLRIDGATRASEFFDNMQTRPIVASTWQEATIEAPVVGPRATEIAFGGLASGSGAIFFDDFVLEAAAPGATEWTPVPLDNAGFEATDPLAGWKLDAPAHTHGTVTDAHGGRAALRIERKSSVVTKDVFEERPTVGETFEGDLGAGLRCRVVLGLPAGEGKAIAAVKEVPLPGPEDPAVRAAAVVVAWNVLRHFYPYHDVIGENWNAVLDAAIADVLDDHGADDTMLTLRRLVHRLHDGHGWVNGPVAPTGKLALRMMRVDGKVVVLAAPKGSPIVRGDEVLRIDDLSIDSIHRARVDLMPGSPQWIEHSLFGWGRITDGPVGSHARVEVRRGEDVKSFELERLPSVDPPDEFERPYRSVLADGVVYVDLVRIPQDELVAKMPEIAKAPGVIFDVRGYPKSDPVWLPHLLSVADLAKWMFVPHIVRPDYVRVTRFTEHGWDVQPAKPRIAGKVAFITGPGAISYAESLMGYVEGYRLGAIVGSPTAGANGDVNPFSVPGGFQVVFTGLKVTRIDGRQHHVLGVQPTHPVKRTLAGILAGRDEELEAALELVRPRKRER
jgi:hypothetical protein